MVYAENFVQLRLEGTFGPTGGAPTDRWTVGAKFRNPGSAPTPANLDAFLADCEGPVETFHAHPAVGVGSNCFLQEITAAYIGTNGRYVGGASQETTRRVTGPTPGAQTTTGPWTQALCISLRTILGRGPGSNGRMYYPATGFGIEGATGLVSTGIVDAWVTQATALLNGLNAAAEANLPGTGGLSVMSQVGTGVAATVTAFRIGRRLDRQERRENELSEDYRGAALAAAARVGEPRTHRPIGD